MKDADLDRYLLFATPACPCGCGGPEKLRMTDVTTGENILAVRVIHPALISEYMAAHPDEQLLGCRIEIGELHEIDAHGNRIASLDDAPMGHG